MKSLYNLHEVLLTTHGGVNVKTKFRFICDNNRTIMNVVEDMAKSSVDIDNFKRQTRNKDDIELFLVLGKFFLKQVILKVLSKSKASPFDHGFCTTKKT
jgi:hypothetical protein